MVAGILLAAPADATITASHRFFDQGTMPDTGQWHVTYRIVIDVTDTPPDDPNGYSPGPDDWTAAALEVDLVGGTFFQHPDGGNPPAPILPPGDYGLEHDTFFTFPDCWPNAPDNQGCLGGVALINETPTSLEVNWFDVIGTGNGQFVIAQITVLPIDREWTATGRLQYAAVNSGGDLFEYHFVLSAILPGDVDGDGDVDLADLAALLASYNACAGEPGYDPDADFDESGCVELSDLALLLANYGFGS